MGRRYIIATILLALCAAAETTSFTSCLPICCHESSNSSSASGMCASVSMVDGTEAKEADVCTKGFYSSSPSQTDYAFSEPSCAGGERPGEMALSAPRMLRGRKITKNLMEVQLSLPRGFISTFFNTRPPAGRGYSSSKPPPPHPIPTSFCPTAVDELGRVEKVLVCPRARLRATKLTKCCPFGQELQFPAFPSGGRCGRLTGIAPQGSDARRRGDGRRWYLRINGYRISLQNLVRFPVVSVLHEPARNPWGCRDGEVLAADYEAFQFNKEGKLTFTRLLGSSRVLDDFCVDSISAPHAAGDAPVIIDAVHKGSGREEERSAASTQDRYSHRRPRHRQKGGRGGTKPYRPRHFLMAALYCVPPPVLLVPQSDIGGNSSQSHTALALAAAAEDSLREDVWIESAAGKQIPGNNLALLLCFIHSTWLCFFAW